MFSSPLRRAIARGMKPDGNLADELGSLSEYSVHSKKDATAICEALSCFPSGTHSSQHSYLSPLHALTSLFQDVDGCESPAFEVLYEEGIPELIRIFDATLPCADEDELDDLLFILKVLAMYGSAAGAEKVVEAAAIPLNPDAFLWHVIMAAFAPGHPHRDQVYAALSEPLPTGFLAVALLDSANVAAIEYDLTEHPFDSPPGWQRLQEWLVDCDQDHTSYAHSATAALPFVSNPARDQLLALAMEHPDTGVQMESAWAAGKLGREAGLKVLARFCLDVNHADVAQRYLAELDREDLIPDDATDLTFQAKAEFARWLAHPNELGQPPDELEIVDHRELAWPPTGELKPFWIIQYRVRDRTGLEHDDVDCGLVGSATWCFFSYNMHQRPPEDVYAIHSYWEMQHAELIVESEVTDANEYVALLDQWQGQRLEEPHITQVAEVSPKLKVPARLVALATAQLDQQPGWVVLDGPRSTWYPQDEQPQETHDGVVLKIHIGRQLLALNNPLDRKRYLTDSSPTIAPADFVAAYEQHMSDASQADPKVQRELLGNRSLLARHFDRYIDAMMSVNGRTKPELVIDAYGRFLQLAQQADESVGDQLYDSFSVLGENFDTYVDALVSLGRATEVSALIDTFAPHWPHNLGYSKLGSAAFRASQREVAESYFLNLRDGMERYYGGEEMSMLAEIWHDRGNCDAAQELLIDCMQRLIADIRESQYNSDRQMFADEFRYHRTTFLRLFPQAESELGQLGVPVNPL